VIDVICKRCPFSVLKLVKPCSRLRAIVQISMEKVYFGYVIVAEVLVVALVLVCLV
jgi:hypothetical protein